MSELNNIPKHWQVKKLGEVCKLKNGFAFKSTEYQKEGVPVIRISDINQGIVSGEDAIKVQAQDVYENYLVENNDILVAMSGATTGKFGIYISTEKAYQNQRVGKFKILDENVLNNQFLFYQINSLKRQIEKDAYGGAQPNISSNKIEQMDIVLPPLHEQLAIVSKIEELLSDLENGKQQLLTAQQQLKVYRQSLLKAAFTSTTLSDRGISSLSEAEAKNHNAQNVWSSSEAETKSELKKGWEIVELSDVADMCLGKMLDKSKNKGEYQYYLRNISVRWGSFDLDGLEQMRFEESESERFGLKKGDLVICEGGEPGRCAIWNIENSGIKIQKALHRVRVSYKLNVKFLFYYLYYSGMTGLLEKYFTGTTIKHLTGSGLKKVRIPLPPISEQQLIVDELESKLTVCDKIEETISQSLLQAETLKQSILKKAFEGKLV